MIKEPITNCHVHTFTADHVPPFLAKSYVPTPFHFLLPLTPIVSFFRWWYKWPAKLPYTLFYKWLEKTYTAITAFLTRLYPLNVIAAYYVFLFAFVQLYILLFPSLQQEADQGFIERILGKAYHFLVPYFPTIQQNWIRIGFLLFALFFFQTIRNILFMVAKLLVKALAMLPGKQTREMIGRYLNIGRYAFHREQATIFGKLRDQYPAGTRFVILPMDMDYMAAGKSKTRYRDQMESLAELKEKNEDILQPFVFADPRRMVLLQEEKRSLPNDKEYFSWLLHNGKVVLGDCFIRDYLEIKKFSGIKIYPALGYYPFDEKLLPLWKYAADNQVPITTHCIRGTIFYRGLKKDGWNAHPVFKQAMEPETTLDGRYAVKETPKTKYIPLVLPQTSNVEFSYHFTHPMNYLCLLEETLLRQLITAAKEKDPETKLVELFGYTGPENKLQHDLSHLKICLAHFGGDDEWKRYFEKDRYDHSNQLAKHPEKGISFVNKNGDFSWGKLEQLWKYTDWYSIICSMMLQYPNVYADISYILHDPEILPLLQQTLQNPGLRDKVLYGTDFFVVRNHKSDKNMLADMQGGLSTADFDQIARINPEKFL